MKWHEMIGGLFWLVVGLVLTGLSATYPIGNFQQPGTGFFPFGLGLLLIALAVALLVKTLRLPQRHGERVQLFPGGVRRVSLVIAVLLAAIAVFESVGYLLTFLFLLLLVTLLTGWLQWKASLVFVALSLLGVYVIFVWLLKQPLPTGFLGV